MRGHALLLLVQLLVLAALLLVAMVLVVLAVVLLLLALALLLLALVAGWIASLTEKGSEFLTLVKGSRTEIRKVVWPTRQETTQTTLIVFVFVIITGLILWGLDSVLGWLASLILG